MTAPASYSHTGIDVSKATLDLRVHESAHAQGFPNAPRGHRKIVALLRAANTRLVVLEASGGYEKPLIAALVNAGIRVACVQPQVARHFAKSLRIRAKTDAIDAAVLARLAHDRHDDLPVIDRLDPAREQLRRLVTRRTQLVEQQTMEKNHLGQAADKLIVKSIRAVLRCLAREIDSIERSTAQIIKANPELNDKARVIRQTDGAGPVTTAVLLACLPELGHAPDKQLNSLVGVAPFNHDSGPFKGKRRIAGGRTLVRNTLYMACLSASRWNQVIRDYYQRLRANGLPHKSALIACIRKMLAHLNRKLAQLQVLNPQITPPLA